MSKMALAAALAIALGSATVSIAAPGGHGGGGGGMGGRCRRDGRGSRPCGRTRASDEPWVRGPWQVRWLMRPPLIEDRR
jgi:hypothetical protein